MVENIYVKDMLVFCEKDDILPFVCQIVTECAKLRNGMLQVTRSYGEEGDCKECLGESLKRRVVEELMGVGG